MRIIQLNLAYDSALRDPEQLLDRYHTLTGLSQALTAAGAEVHVVQRFSRQATLTREQVVNDVLLEAQPTKQFVTVEQVAGLAVFLCSDAASQITGANLSMDGGWTAR